MVTWVRQVYLIANINFTLSWGRSCCIFNTRRPSFRLPLPLIPSTTISLHFFIQLSLSILSTCPNHLRLPLCFQFLILTWGHLSTHYKTLFPSVSHCTTTAPSCHFSSAVSTPLLSLPRSHYHKEQEEHSWHSENSLEVPVVMSCCHVMLSCHAVMSCCHVMLSCHAVMSCCHVMLSCHIVMSCCHVMLSCHAVMSCCHVMLSCHAVMSCCHVMLSCHVVMSCCHVMLTCHVVMSCCHVMSCYVVMTCHVMERERCRGAVAQWLRESHIFCGWRRGDNKLNLFFSVGFTHSNITH